MIAISVAVSVGVFGADALEVDKYLGTEIEGTLSWDTSSGRKP